MSSVNSARLLRIIRRAKKENATRLDLSRMEIETLPPEIGLLTNLKELCLAWNDLRIIPPEFGDLTGLTILQLWGNQLTTLPPEIGRLNQLRELVSSTNQLEALPPQIGQLTNLETLILHDNRLSSLPSEIGNLQNLRALDLKYNRLKELPPEMGQLSNLEYLNVRHNSLAQFPPEIGRLSKLTALVAHDNPLRELPVETGQLANLESLYLTHTKLTSIPAELQRLPRLANLDLRFNQPSLSSQSNLRLPESPRDSNPGTDLRAIGATRIRRKPRASHWRKNWTSFRDWIVAHAVRFPARLCMKAPRRIGLRAGRWAGTFSFVLSREHRETALANLEKVFGGELSPSRRRSLARESFQSAALAVVETLQGMTWSEQQFRETVVLEGREHAQATLALGKGALFTSGHFGSWGLICGAVEAHTGIAVEPIMRDLRNREMNSLYLALRADLGRKGHSVNQAGMSYLRTLSQGGAVLILADQDTRRSKGIAVEFLGKPAYTPIGPAFLARKTGAPILPLFIRRDRNDPLHHVLRCLPPIFPDPSLAEEEDLFRMLQSFTAALESEIRSDPGQWVWMHDRWRQDPRKSLADSDVDFLG